MSLEKEPLNRFNLSDPILFNNVETFGLLTKYPFLDAANLEDSQIQTIAVTQEMSNNPPIISNILYGTPMLDWVIVLFNKPLNPVNWPKTGSIIRAPIADVVLPLV